MRRLRIALTAALAAAALSPGRSNATLVVNAAVGGSPTGNQYVNFDNLPLGDAGGSSGGVGVSFSGSAQAVEGSLDSSTYIAPFLSNSNGMLFGDPTVSGPDTTTYLTTGTGQVTLTLPSLQQYFGLLWGSVEPSNTLSFYDGATLVVTVTGTEVSATADGNQGASGTFYVNVNATPDDAFNRVVATGTTSAFEFDNVSYSDISSPPTSPIPEPAALAILVIGLAGIAGVRLVRP